MSLALLKKEAQEVAARMESRLKVAIDEDRDLTAEEDKADKEDQVKIDEMKAKIERKQKMAERVTALNATTSQISIVADASEREESRLAEVPVEQQTGSFANLAEFGLAVCRATDPRGTRQIDERLAAPTNYHQEVGDSTNTGFMVPPAYREQIWTAVMDGDQDVVGMVDNEPTNSNMVQLGVDDSTPWGATGVQANWRTEGSQMTASKLQTDPRNITLNELYAFVTATDELMQDAPRLNRRLTEGAARAIRWKSSDACFYGDGVGKPLGWFNSSSLVTVAKESGQSADTVVAANVAKMYARNLNPGRSVWFINNDVLPQLITMTLGDQPIWIPPVQGMQQGVSGGFLLGRPVYITQHAKTVGDKGDIQFVDPMGYYLATKRTGVQFAESMHLFFDYGVNAFRWTFRMGGAPYLNSAISPANGSSNLSHFVTLAART